MKKLIVTSNMLNEITQLPEWFDFVEKISDGIVIVDGGSKDGTLEYAKKRKAFVIVDDIIQKEGYGPARTHLRIMARKFFPDAEWNLTLDADERILKKDFHILRWIKDSLSEDYDVVALPRIDWMDKSMTRAARDWRVYPDPQARMTRLYSPLRHVRVLHEQVVDFRKIYFELTNPMIHHFHRSTTQDKRDFVGRVCAYLHDKDEEYGHTYPKHAKENYYYQQYLEKGLNE